MGSGFLKRFICGVTLVAFMLSSVAPSYAQLASSAGTSGGSFLDLPAPGTMVALSQPFNPPLLKGIKVFPKDPFRFDFILDKGDVGNDRDRSLQDESTRLIKYFLASLTVPENDLWVNLSPYEKDRIVPEAFGQTEMGRDLLAQDYLLKQITASVIYPEGDVGKTFWAEIYKKAQEQFGTADIPIDTFNKVWIIPEKAVVYENAQAGTAYVVQSRLKVMLESDYLATSRNEMPTRGQEASQGNSTATNDISKQVLREIVIPILEREVNEGKNFVQLRQVYQSLILASWYKKKIKESLLSQMYVNHKKITGITIEDPKEFEKIWVRYIEAFKKGAFNFIKEEQNVQTKETLPRRYFSGGLNMLVGQVLEELSANDDATLPVLGNDNAVVVSVDMAAATSKDEAEQISQEFFQAEQPTYGTYKMLLAEVRSQIAQHPNKLKKALSFDNFFRRDFKEQMRLIKEKKGTDPIVVFSDHFDIDSLVSTFSEAYLLYLMMFLTGRQDTPVIPLIKGSSQKMDALSQYVLEKVFGKAGAAEILQKICFTDDVGLSKDLPSHVQYVQVDSNGTSTWLTIDHHQKKNNGLKPGEGSRIEPGASAALLVSEEYGAAGLPINNKIAWMTLYSVQADTMNFTENMVGANPYEKVVELLLPVLGMQEKDLGSFYQDFVRVAYDIDKETPKQMLVDTKPYLEDDKVLVSQRFFVNAERFWELVPGIMDEMKKGLLSMEEKKPWIYIGTDVQNRESFVFVVCPNGQEGLLPLIHDALRVGGEESRTVQSVPLFKRPEMLRKQFIENDGPMLEEALRASAGILNRHPSDVRSEWLKDKYRIFYFARDHHLEYSWASVFYGQHSPSNHNAMADALKILLLSNDENMRQGAAWVASHSEFIGPVEIPQTVGWWDRSLMSVLSAKELEEQVLLPALSQWFKANVKGEEARELFFCQLEAIVFLDVQEPLRYQRAVKLLGLLKSLRHEEESARWEEGDMSRVQNVAMTTGEAGKDAGGIDLTPQRIDIKTAGSGGAIKFHFDSVQLEQFRNASGLAPVIINIQPMTDLKLFLGLKEQKPHPNRRSFSLAV